jgi:hypothetical protein
MVLVAVLATACGDDPAATVEITSPTPGQVVSLPFEIRLEASVPLGPAGGDLHHAHVWFGDDLTSYAVVEGEVGEITSAPDGEHEMHVSLRNPDHSDAGDETSITLVISGGTTG